MALGETILFTYDVAWVPSDTHWASRWDIYLTMNKAVKNRVSSIALETDSAVTVVVVLNRRESRSVSWCTATPVTCTWMTLLFVVVVGYISLKEMRLIQIDGRVWRRKRSVYFLSRFFLCDIFPPVVTLIREYLKENSNVIVFTARFGQAPILLSLSASATLSVFFFFRMFSSCISDGMADDAQVHWFSIVNSLLIVLFLTAMIAMILIRNLHRDIMRYNRVPTDEEKAEEREETGWKVNDHGRIMA